MIKKRLLFILSWGFKSFVAGAGVLLATTVPSFAATLIHSNDVSGEIEPCGCRSNPQGGMARKFNFLKKIEDPFVIQVDAGDLLFPTREVPELLKTQSKLQAKSLLQMMDQVHHDLVVPGEKDFALGFSVFEELRKGSKAKFLAANLNKNGGKYLDAHVVLSGKDTKGKEIRVGIFGLVGSGLPFPKPLSVSPPIPAAKKEVEYLKSQGVDTIIAVTHQGVDKDEALAKAVPEINLIVGAHSESFLQEPRKVGTTFIVQSSFRNQYIGVLPLGKPIDITKYSLEPLEASFDSPEGNPSTMDKSVDKFKEDIAKINSEKEAEIEALTLGPNGSKSDRKFQTFPRCAECHFKQYEFWRQTNHARALEPLLEKKEIRNKECLTCHTVGLGDPKGFRDVTSLAQLRLPKSAEEPEEGTKSPKSESKSDLESLSPEETTYLLKALRKAGLKDSIKIRETDKETRVVKQIIGSLEHSWAPVQCENCHLPGRDHPFVGRYSKVVEKDACLKCHTFVRAPDWYDPSGKPKWDLIEAKRKMITCPAGDMTESE